MESEPLEALVQNELSRPVRWRREIRIAYAELVATPNCTHLQHAHDITCQRVLSPVGSVNCTAVQGRHRAAKNFCLIVFEEEGGSRTRWETARIPSEDSFCSIAYWLHAHWRSEDGLVQLSPRKTDGRPVHSTYRGYRSGMEAIHIKHRGKMQRLIYTEKIGPRSYGSTM